MTFDEVLAHVLDLLQREGRVSYRALTRRFELDDDYLEDLKAEIIQAKRLGIDEGGVVLVWVGAATAASAAGRPPRPCCSVTRWTRPCRCRVASLPARRLAHISSG
jgi:hypothetical protein